MKFVTIPDIENIPMLINKKHVESIIINEQGKLEVNMVSGKSYLTDIPREILVMMLMKEEKEEEQQELKEQQKSILVQSTQEWVG